MARAKLDEAILSARNDDFLRALTIFLDVYGSDDAPRLNTPKSAAGLSWFGLAIALVRRQYKPALDLCRRAIELEFYNAEHYANLARVYVAAGNRRKALETVEEGLTLVPEDEYLISVRDHLGRRSRPSVPFLDRNNPINVSLGQARHAKKISETEKKKEE
jgi:tetratricopeptide (TPR) repeat protein